MKKFIKRVFVNLGGDACLRMFNRQPRVLFWHGVDYQKNPDVEQEICDISIFEKQIDYLRHHFEIIPIQEFEERFRSNHFSGHEIVLTFDDGYANNLYVVEPILSQYSLPFTVFISTEHIDNGTFFPTSVNRIITSGSGVSGVKIPSLNLYLPLSNPIEVKAATSLLSSYMKHSPMNVVRQITDDLINNVSEDYWIELKEKYKSVRPMTWDEVQLLSKKGVTIGSHCMWHICCHENQEHYQVEEQIRLSKLSIQKRLGCDCSYFAYPNGDYTDFSNECLKRHYNMGFTTRMKNRIHAKMDSSIIPRMGMPSNLDTFKIILNLYPNK